MTSIEFAISLEVEGEKYYKRQAELNKDNFLNSVFTILAKEEQRHAKILQDLIGSKKYELDNDVSLNEIDNIFLGLKDFAISLTDESEKQLAVYEEALIKEKQSIDLYEELLMKSTTEQDKKIFNYLIAQEQQHHRLFTEIIALVSRPKEWVESAEFGIREEY